MTENYRQAFPERERGPWLSYGIPFDQAAHLHVSETLHASHVYIIASGSLSRNTDNLDKLKNALTKDRVAGLRIGMNSHTQWSEILEIVADVKRVQADVLLTIGGGTLIDGAKIVSLALANDVSTAEELATLTLNSPTKRAVIISPEMPLICIPTSLSGAEISNFAGGTDDRTHRKHSFAGHVKEPTLVIYDPELSMTTPATVWLSSGIRSVDHCVETLCSLGSTPDSDRDAEAGLKKLIPGILTTMRDPENLDARLQSQLGVVLAMGAITRGVPLGASHGIGHQLGPLGVGHGETSCILLPAVCKWNLAKGANVERQKIASDILWEDPTVGDIFNKIGLKKESSDLGDLLDAIIRTLGLPRTLAAVGVGQDKLSSLAANSLHDRFVKSNPYPIRNTKAVMEILKMVVG